MTDYDQSNEEKRESLSEKWRSTVEKMMNESPHSLLESDEETIRDEKQDLAELEAADPDDELLTAFIDGEMSEEEKKKVEKRLAEDPDFARRFQKLQFAGHVVESLAPVTGDQRLTASTMSLLSDLIQKEIERVEKRRLRRTLLILSAFFIAGFIAFAAGGWFAVHYFSGKQANDPSVERNNPKDFSNRRFLNSDHSFPRAKRLGDRGRGDPFGWGERYGNYRFQRTLLLRDELPEELRQENLGALNRELFEFVRSRAAMKLGNSSSSQNPVSKERLLYDYIQEKGMENLISRLSQRGQVYIRTVDSSEQIRLIGLLIMSGLFDRRNWNTESSDDALKKKSPVETNSPNSSEESKIARPPAEKFPDSLSQKGKTKSLPSSPRLGEVRGFFWKNETTSDLSETLKKLDPQQREELLNLPDEEMYAQLLILHWGFDPKGNFPGIPPRGRGWEPRSYQRLSGKDSFRPDPNEMEKPWKDWDDFVRKEVSSSQKSRGN